MTVSACVELLYLYSVMLMHNIAAVASEDICRILFVCLVGVLRFKFEV